MSTWQTQCGIASYTKDLVAGLAQAGISTAVVPIDRRQMNRLRPDDLVGQFEFLADEAAAAGDLVHLQHEPQLLSGSNHPTVSYRVLRSLIARLESKGIPLVITWHTEPSTLGRLLRRPRDISGRLLAGREWRKTAAALDSNSVTNITHTPTTHDSMVHAGVAAGHVNVIPIGAPPFHPAALSQLEIDESRRGLGIPADASVMTIFGFVARRKGYMTALAALEELPSNHHLVVAGGSNPFGSEQELNRINETVAMRPALDGRVHVTGYVADSAIDSVMGATDVCLAPYPARTRQSSSAAITNGIASGKPVVASDIPAFRDVSDRGHSIMLVPPDDPHALATAVLELAADEDLRGRLRARAAEYCDRYGWPQTALRHAAVYESLLKH